MCDMPTVVSAHTEELDSDTRTAISEVCRIAHQEESFLRLFTYIPSGGLHALAYCARQLVGHAVATTRWLQPEGLPLLRTAYIDAVATLPAFQGRGIGSAVMRQLAAGLAEYEIACLETDRVSFYQRLGWELWRGPLAGRRAGELVPTPEQTGIMILRLARTPALDLDGLLVIEADGRIW